MVFSPNLSRKQLFYPFFKKDDPEIMSNYRPISILPTLSKVIEKCLKTRLLHYFSRNNLFNKCQFGFQTGVSTQYAILHITEKICDNEFVSLCLQLHNYVSTLQKSNNLHYENYVIMAMPIFLQPL